MSSTAFRPFDHPAAWTTRDYPDKDSLAIDLAPRHVAALLDGLAALKRENGGGAPGHAAVSADRFPLSAIGDEVASWREAVRNGRGIIILRGFPIEAVDDADLRLIYLGLGCHFGRPVSQSALGDLVGDVVNVGGKDRRERAYRNSRALRLHTDRCDHIAMLCLRPAMQGGISAYASGLAIHNAILAERPDLLAPLYTGFHHHRFGEQPPGEPVVTRERIPIFSETAGVPNVIYIRGYIDLAIEEGHVRLSEPEQAALALLDEICDRPEVRLRFLLEPGELALTNNCLLLHTRDSFEDSPDPARRRHLLRLWLREDGRPAAPGVIAHKGGDGIARREGKGTYYTPGGAALSAEPDPSIFGAQPSR